MRQNTYSMKHVPWLREILEGKENFKQCGSHKVIKQVTLVVKLVTYVVGQQLINT